MPAAVKPVASVGAQATPYILMIPQHASPSPVKLRHHSLLEAVQLSLHLSYPLRLSNLPFPEAAVSGADVTSVKNTSAASSATPFAMI